MIKLVEKIFFVVLFGLIILQMTFIPQSFFYQVIPNIVLSFLIASVLLGKIRSVFIMAFLAGLILDITSGLPFGVITASLILAVFTVNALSSKFLKSPEFFILAPIGFLGVAVYNLALLILANISNSSAVLEEIGQVFFMIILKVIVELVLALIFYGFILRLRN